MYLPSASDKIEDRICQTCSIYHVSAAGLQRHIQAVHGKNEENDAEDYKESGDFEEEKVVGEDNEFEEDNGSVQNGSDLPIIKDMQKWMSCDWEEDKEDFSCFLFTHLCCENVFHVSNLGCAVPY